MIGFSVVVYGVSPKEIIVRGGHPSKSFEHEKHKFPGVLATKPIEIINAQGSHREDFGQLFEMSIALAIVFDSENFR